MNLFNRSSQLFLRILAYNASVLFAMSLQRLVLFLVVVRHWLFGIDSGTVVNSFVTGVRFDLCVLGFMNIPVLLIMWGISSDWWTSVPNAALQFTRKWILWTYFVIATLVIHALGLLDLMFFANNGHRWTYDNYVETGFGFVTKTLSKWNGLFSLGVIGFFFLLWLFRSVVVLYRLQLHTVPAEFNRFGKNKAVLFIMGFVFPLLVVLLAARGTWTPHHLALEHAQVSSLPELNQLVLSPVWAFDKKF